MKYEYKATSLEYRETCEMLINNKANDGWKLHSCTSCGTSILLIFERIKETPK